MDPRLLRIVEQLRASRFADLGGMRLGASIPIAESLLNDVVTALLPPSAHVAGLSVHPQRGNRIAVRAKLARVEFLPPLNVTLEIERQPELPDGPLVLRLLSLPGLISLLGPSLPVAARLPPGVRMDKDRIYVDLKALADSQGLADLLPLLSQIRIVTDDGKLIVELDVRVKSAAASPA